MIFFRYFSKCGIRWLLVIIAGLIPFIAVYAQNDALDYGKTITAEELKSHVEVLAHDSLEGRETGEPGQKKAAHYLSQYLRSIGVGGVNGEHFQEFPLYTRQVDNSIITINQKEFNYLKDYYFFSNFNDTLIDTDKVIFAGFGISDPVYDDYENIDVQGHVLVYFNREPETKKGISLISGNKRKSDWTMKWGKKVDLAISKGAGAVLIVMDNMQNRAKAMSHSLGKRRMRLAVKDNDEHSIPVIYISEEMAGEILSKSKYSLRKYRKTIEKKGKPLSVEVEVDLKIDVKRKERVFSSENVLGYIEGTDLKDELIIITAHYDHIGIKDGKIHNGADDDASGTSALMEIAQAFKKAKDEGNGPRRSILIMPVSGEEKGLLGSQYYVENPLFPLENTVANLNIDMIGRRDTLHDHSNYVYLIGSDRLSKDLHKISESTNRKYSNLELDYRFNSPNDVNRFYSRSDHYNFAKNNIPVIFYFSGVHKDYHKPTDTIEKLEFPKIEKTAQLVFYTAWELANRDERPVLDVNEE